MAQAVTLALVKINVSLVQFVSLAVKAPLNSSCALQHIITYLVIYTTLDGSSYSEK